MALAKKKSNSTRLVVVIVVILAIVGVGYLLFKQFFLQDPDLVNQAFNANRRSTVITNFGESFLQDPRFKNLKSYDVSINVNVASDGGQVNPFQ